MNKKGIFYTIAAITLTIVIIVIYSAYNSYRLNEKMEVIETRIETVNFFIKDVEKDMDKGAFIAGFRTFISFNQFIAANGTYIDNINERFEESFLNGTIKGQPLSLMKDSTFVDWVNKISAEADKIDITFNFTVNDVKVNQSDPWHVLVGLNLSLEIRDKRNTSYWVRDRFLTTSINIIGLEDPIYVINSHGRVTNAIVPSNISQFVIGGDVKNLLVHANNSLYLAHNDSPDFLMRLQGDLGNSTNGIESLVNLDKFQQQGLAIKEKSIVDSIYFGNIITTNFRVNNTPEWFRIDQEHLELYQVENITI